MKFPTLGRIGFITIMAVAVGLFGRDVLTSLDPLMMVLSVAGAGLVIVILAAILVKFGFLKEDSPFRKK